MSVAFVLLCFGFSCLLVLVGVLVVRVHELSAQLDYISDVVNGLCKDNGRFRIAQSSTTTELLKLYNAVRAVSSADGSSDVLDWSADV